MPKGIISQRYSDSTHRLVQARGQPHTVEKRAWLALFFHLVFLFLFFIMLIMAIDFS